MVLLGGAPAALIGVATILAGWLRWRENVGYLLNNVLTYRALPADRRRSPSRAVAEATGLTAADAGFYLLSSPSSSSPWRSTS